MSREPRDMQKVFLRKLKALQIKYIKDVARVARECCYSEELVIRNAISNLGVLYKSGEWKKILKKEVK